MLDGAPVLGLAGLYQGTEDAVPDVIVGYAPSTEQDVSIGGLFD